MAANSRIRRCFAIKEFILPQSQTKKFYYVDTKEPHRSRGTQILKTYPQAKTLLGPDWRTAFCILFVGIAQSAAAVLMSSHSWGFIVLSAWIFGSFLTHALFVLIHESTHDLVFKRKWANRWVAILANLPVGVPMAMAFRTFHLLHHTHQGDPDWDADLPSEREAEFVGVSSLRKTFWLLTFFLNEAFYRPTQVKRRATSWKWTLANYAAEITYCFILVSLFGFKAYAYLLLAMFFSVGLHPLGARVIQEHFVFREGQETYSYYGPFNKVMFNVGFHNEHHDLPYVSWSRLPKIRQLVPEMYDKLYSHSSYWKLLKQFLFDPGINLHSRIVRFPEDPFLN